MDRATWTEFEGEKQQLVKQDLSAAEYEQQIRRLCEKYEL